MSLVLHSTFERTKNLSEFVQRHFPLTFSPPKTREPEFGVRLTTINDAYILEDEFCALPQVRLICPPVAHDGILVSLAQDVVDEQGMPIETLSENNIESRRRFNLVVPEKKLTRFDVSFKDAGKTMLRREWEGAASCLDSGYDEAAAKLAEDVPQITQINRDSFRIIGVCMNARSSNYHFYMLADQSAILELETNDDICLFSTPHADRILGYRFEREPEVKSIRLGKRSPKNDSWLNEILDRGLEEIKDTIRQSSVASRLKFENVSKGGEIVDRVAAHYDAEATYPNLSGRSAALLQNVKAFHYYGKISALCALAAHIPSARQVADRDINHHQLAVASAYPNLHCVA